MATDQIHEASSFNEAPALSPGKTLRKHHGRRWEFLGFNEAWLGRDAFYVTRRNGG